MKLSADKLGELLELYSCEEADLPDFGYYPTGKKGEFVTYESSSDLRDSESVPLTQSIYQYFIDEVQPHVAEAWLNMESIKIGYEVSFNKYFYRHKPLRSLETVAQEILALEQQADGLIAQILGLTTPIPRHKQETIEMMLTAMPKYDTYKDSGVEWLGIFLMTGS